MIFILFFLEKSRILDLCSIKILKMTPFSFPYEKIQDKQIFSIWSQDAFFFTVKFILRVRVSTLHLYVLNIGPEPGLASKRVEMFSSERENSLILSDSAHASFSTVELEHEGKTHS